MSGSTDVKQLKDAFIFKVLDISTAHMTLEDSKGLATNSSSAANAMAPVYELGEYGWLAYVGEIDDNWPVEDGWSEAFRTVMKTAQAMGCDYVRWDRDGRDYEELEKFNW